MTRASVLFRGDASHATGYGHLARLCALIEELGAFDPDLAPIAMFGGDATVAAWAASHHIAADIRPASAPWTTHDLLAAAAAPGVRAVIIDGPALADELAPALVAQGIRTILIDDAGTCPRPVHAIVNHNFHAPALAAGYPRAALRLLGRPYLLLRRTIRRHPHAACQPARAARLRVVVTFGGSDPVRATARTLRLLPTDRALDVIALAGPGFGDHADLERAARIAMAAGHTVTIVQAPDDPGTLFVSADAAICSAGGTLGELAYLGCPALAFAIVPDQLAPARAQRLAGLISGGHSWADAPDALIRAELSAFLLDDQRREAQRALALATADALGARRVLAAALA